MKNRVSLLMIIVVMGLVLPAWAKEYSQKLMLKINLNTGDKYKVVADTQQDISQTIMGADHKMSQTEISETICEVINVDSEGVAQIKSTFARMCMKMETPAMNVDYDSADPNTVPDTPQKKMMALIWSSIIGHSYIMKVDSTGKIVSVEGLEEMLDKVFDEICKSDPGAAAAVKQMMAKFLNEDFFRSMGNSMFVSLLDEPVKVGDVWYDNMSVNAGFPIDFQATYVLKSLGKDTALIDMVSKIDMGDVDSNLIEVDGIKMNMQITGTMSGHMDIEKDTCMLKQSITDYNFSGALKMQPNQEMPDGMSIPIAVKGVSKCTVEKI